MTLVRCHYVGLCLCNTSKVKAYRISDEKYDRLLSDAKNRRPRGPAPPLPFADGRQKCFVFVRCFSLSFVLFGYFVVVLNFLLV